MYIFYRTMHAKTDFEIKLQLSLVIFRVTFPLHFTNLGLSIPKYQKYSKILINPQISFEQAKVTWTVHQGLQDLL